ncbi:MAG: hypothetical protein AAFY88_12645, partial [Acidobacteriota bacterium]
LAATSTSPDADLPEGPIFWRVAGLDAVGNPSAFSAADELTVDVTAPAAVIELRRTWDTTATWSLRWRPAPEADFSHYAVYRELAPFTDVAGLTPIDTSITVATESRYVDPSPLPGQDGYYAVVAVDTAGNALGAVESVAAPGPAPIFADSFETGDLSSWSAVIQ